MQIAPEIVARHWEAAAAEQLARNLEREGYQVSEREVIGDRVADVVARRGGEVVVFGVKSPPWDERQAHELVELRDSAVGRLGAKFRLVVVTPPQRDLAAEIEGLDRILLEQIAEPLPEPLASLSSRTKPYAVTDIEIGSIAVRPPEIEVAGDAVVHVALAWDDGGYPAEDRDSFPLTFALKLDTGGKLLSVDRLKVDTTAWQSADEDLEERPHSSAEENGAHDSKPWHGEW